jgi:hypothetical protein
MGVYAFFLRYGPDKNYTAFVKSQGSRTFSICPFCNTPAKMEIFSLAFQFPNSFHVVDARTPGSFFSTYLMVSGPSTDLLVAAGANYFVS